MKVDEHDENDNKNVIIYTFFWNQLIFNEKGVDGSATCLTSWRIVSTGWRVSFITNDHLYDRA